jgi:Mg-chelatase subunit ChlD
MNFAAPAFAWALLALLPLAAVYLIRVRPRRRPVNAFFLWDRLFEQNASNAWFRRLRQWLSLLLLALAFLAAILALMKPVPEKASEADLLIVIDRSVSMRGGESGTRLELAKARAQGWIDALGGNRRAALATADTGLNYRVHLTANARALRRALEDIEPSDLPLRTAVVEELGLLASLANHDEEDPVRVLFLTDGRAATGEFPEGVERVLVGDPEPNAGITAADLRWTARGQARLFVAVRSGFSEPREVELELVGAENGELARLFSMTLDPNTTSEESIAVESIDPGAWVLRLNLDDDLAADNVAALGLNAPQPVPVQIDSPNPFFFQQVVTAFQRADSLFEPVENFGLLGLAEGTAPPTGVGLIFAPAGDSPFWSGGGDELAPAAPEITTPDHPLIARLDPTMLGFEGARDIEAPAGSVVVLAHPDGAPLLYTAVADGRRMVVANLDPLRGNFFLSPWFPVLVHDAAAMLMGRENDFPSVVATGEQVAVPGTGEIAEANARRHDGTEITLPRESPITLRKAGNYEFHRSYTRWHTGGAVLAPGESGPPAKLDTATASVEPPSGHPPAVWLLGLAVAVILIEEMLYQRRKVA